MLTRPDRTGRVIVHIGLHKTGSSALQEFLYRHCYILREQGVLYRPTLPEHWPNHNPLADAFKTEDCKFIGEQAVQKLLTEAGDNCALISAEMLSEYGVDVDRFLACLAGVEVRVIAYIRHPCDMMISAFSEIVRAHDRGYTLPINEQPFAYSQMEALTPWLGRTSAPLLIAPYDQRQWPRGSLFADFLSMLGLPLARFDLSDIRVNKSISYAAAERLRRLNMIRPSAEQHAVALGRLQHEGVSPAANYPLSAGTIAASIAEVKKGLKVLRPHFRPGFREDFLFEPRPRVNSEAQLR